MRQTDITNNVAQEAKLNEQVLRTIAEGGSALIAVVGLPDLKILFVNKQFEHYLGYSNEEVNAGNILFTDLLENYQNPRLLYQFSIIDESYEARSKYVIYRLKGKDQNVLPFFLYACPAHADGEETVGMYHLTMHPDLANSDRLITSYNTNELFLKQFNTDDIGTFEWIISGNKLFWSKGIYHIFGVPESTRDLPFQYMTSFIHPDDIERVTGIIDNGFITGNEFDAEFKILTTGKAEKTVNLVARVISNAKGKQVKLSGSIKDITEQRRIESNLRSKVEQLNHSNKELEEFAFVASHDLQEPLRKITTFCDRLQDKYKNVLTGDGAMYLTRMTASAENMRTLINDLLEFSRITKNTLPYETVNLDNVMKEVKTDLELVIEETGTTFISQGLSYIDAVPTQMKQLFTNIINNSIKFRKAGTPPVISISTRPATEREKAEHELNKREDYVLIQIADNGIGFENEYATRIFQVFQRLHGKADYPGSGIGLAICKKITEYHRGSIYATGKDGEGAKFIIMLPKHQLRENK